MKNKFAIFWRRASPAGDFAIVYSESEMQLIRIRPQTEISLDANGMEVKVQCGEKWEVFSEECKRIGNFADAQNPSYLMSVAADLLSYLSKFLEEYQKTRRT